VCCHIICSPVAFSGQLSNGDKDRQNGLFCKAFKRGLCSYAFRIHDLVCDADTKLFRQASDQRHCLHSFLAQQRPQKSLSSLKPCLRCRRKVRLSQKTARQRRQSPNSATVALFCDSVDRLLEVVDIVTHTLNFHCIKTLS